MKQVILALGVLLSGQLLAQNTFPSNGNVGVGTTNPTSGLDVNRHMKVDSTLMVKDSVRIKSRLTVDEKVVFKDNLVVKGDLLRAQNNARINNNLFVDNKLTVDGIARLNGIVKMMGLTEATQQVIDNGGYSLLVTKQNGEVIEVPPTILAGLFGTTYPEPPVDDGSPCSNYNSSILQAAGWAFNENVSEIFTGCSVNKVGIGTYHPDYNLDVNGITRSTRLKTSFIEAGNQLQGQTSVLNAVLSIYGQGPNLIQAGKVINSIQKDYLTLNTNGELTLRNNQDVVPIQIVDDLTGTVTFQVTGNGSTIIRPLNDVNPLVVKNSSGGKILQLENNGLLRTREVKIDLEVWPDYVFEKDYSLLSIEEVAQYIKIYKHLPGVPSALKIKTEGLSVGEMQKILMQKIEELTLYTIEQNNQIKDLETENKQLKSELQQINDRLDQLEAKLNH